MSDDFIKKALEVAAVDYINLMMKRTQLQKEMAALDRQEARLNLKMVSLAALCDEIPADTPIGEILGKVSKAGLTDAVRSVLKSSSDWMTAKQVRDQILKLGVNLDKYQNPLASIHTILGRLKEVEFTLLDEKKNVWGVRWTGPVDPMWERLQNLPREEADKFVAETAKALVHDTLWGKTKKARKVSSKKGKK